MTEYSDASNNNHNVWVRGLFMLLLGFAFQVCGTVLCIVTIVQFVLVLVNHTPNVRLIAFGRSMGSYLRQIVKFQTFATEEIPFPFSEWPADD